jgi:hypothetical protein
MRLGRKPHDAQRVAAVPKHRFGAVSAPPIMMRTLTNFMPGMYGNDTLPDCTAVSLTNSARSVAYSLYEYDLNVFAPDVPLFYGDVIGAPAGSDLADTNGANMLDVIEYQSKNGFNIGTQSLVANYKTLDFTVQNELMMAMFISAHAYLGITLYNSDMETCQVGGILDQVPGVDPGPVDGGHAINAYCYSGPNPTDLVYFGTWATWQPCTWRWLQSRIEEAYVLSWLQLEAPKPTA